MRPPSSLKITPTQKKQEAIFLPLIHRNITSLIILFCASLLAAGILLLPSHNPTLPSWITPDALAMSSISDFPFALGVSYSMGVYAGLVCGFITAFTKGDLKGLGEARLKQSIIFRTLSDVLIFLLIWLLLTHELSENNIKISSGFFYAVTQDRLFALMWIEGIFGFVYTTTLVGLFDTSTLVRKILCK